jgi:hypothetical protein
LALIGCGRVFRSVSGWTNAKSEILLDVLMPIARDSSGFLEILDNGIIGNELSTMIGSFYPLDPIRWILGWKVVFMQEIFFGQIVANIPVSNGWLRICKALVY